MEIYFEFPEFGELMVEHSFYLLDGEPILFVCIDSKGNRFLCSCYQMSTNWVIGRVEEKALLDLIEDRITIREVFKQYCSSKWTVSWDGISFTLNLDVSDDILPKEGACLGLAKEKNGRYKETLKQSGLKKLLDHAPYLNQINFPPCPNKSAPNTGSKHIFVKSTTQQRENSKSYTLRFPVNFAVAA